MREERSELTSTAEVEDGALDNEDGYDRADCYTCYRCARQPVHRQRLIQVVCNYFAIIRGRRTHPAAPVGVAVVIAVTVLTPPYVVVFVDPVLVAVPELVAVGVTTGVELGLESSKHPFTPCPTVNNALDPPWP